MRVVPLALLALGCLASGQITPAGKGYLFRVKFSRGQVMRYELTGQNSPSSKGTPVSMKSIVVLTVLRVSNGIATVKMRRGVVSLNGKPFQPEQMVDGKLDGRMRSVGVGALDTFAGLYPAAPVKIGSSWTAPLKLDASPTPGVIARYTLRQIAVVDGVRVAVLDTRVSGSLRGTGTTLIRTDDGTPQRVKLEVSANMSKGAKTVPMMLQFEVARR